MPDHSSTFECRHRISVLCDRGDGTPRRARCSYCGGDYVVRAGTWAAFTWSPDNRYPLDAALFTGRKAAVERFVASRAGDNVVARFITN